MKILWVNPSFLDYRIPVYKKMNELANGRFSIVYSQKRVPQRVVQKIETAIGANAVGLLNEKLFDIPRRDDFANTDIKIPFQPGLFKAISKNMGDVVIGEGFFQWTPAALMKAKLRRKKFLLAYERTAHTERNCPKWRTMYRKMIARFVNGFLVNGQLTREYLLGLGVSDDKIFIGGMSADSEGLARDVAAFPEEGRLKLKQDLALRKGLVYLFVGQINERKGVIHLLNGWKKHIEQYPDDTLLVIGTGLLYEKYAEDFSGIPSIRMTGNIDYDLIHQYYSISDVFIIPTLEDNWSLVVPEAMACRLPVACSIYNGCYPELIEEGVNGKLFDPLKEESVIETLGYFHGKDLQAMGEASAIIEKRFSSEAVAGHIYDSCVSVMKGKQVVSK